MKIFFNYFYKVIQNDKFYTVKKNYDSINIK